MRDSVARTTWSASPSLVNTMTGRGTVASNRLRDPEQGLTAPGRHRSPGPVRGEPLPAPAGWRHRQQQAFGYLRPRGRTAADARFRPVQMYARGSDKKLMPDGRLGCSARKLRVTSIHDLAYLLHNLLGRNGAPDPSDSAAGLRMAICVWVCLIPVS